MSNQETLHIPTRAKRPFIGEEFDLKKWDDVQPFFENLKNREINSLEDLKQWFSDRSEIESYLSENFAWRYIRQTCDTANTGLINALQFFITEIQPKLAEYGNALDKKIVDNPFLGELTEPGFAITLRGMKKAIEIFREENIPVITEMQTEERKYGAIAGAMTVTLDGEEMTLQRAADRLQSTDRRVREEAWRAISGRRYEDHDKLDELLNKLVTLRDTVGRNAGFNNYRDYMFAAMGRFDYTPQDCFNFHDSVKKAVVPILNEMAAERKAALQLDALRPWDTKVDPKGLPPLKPFETGEELLDKTIRAFSRLDPFLGDCLRIMKTMKHLDLESRKGKAPGGYNYPLDEIGVPFIFMNATSNLRDMVTLLHEGGHAVHSLVTRDLALNSFKHTPSEVAELASMSMELITMDFWDEFFENEEDLKRAKITHLESIIETLPWVATVDKFQHWMYENPQHTPEQRTEAWVRIYEEFTDTVMDWSGLENFKKYLWQRQLHIYEVPFYYIEYGIAQLGAIGVWKNYREDAAKGLKGYLDALKLGYTATIGEIYQAANIPFDFSERHIAELMQFVRDELAELKK
ncbi:oligoendopeptidase F [Dyadobacter sp. BE34]|uniref:Oligoendopeptidase F n=1 Tax=Dyadobacter fermentans TaxID=94254 RepID=A0ABU1R2R7_9BACT|nr:MULTISPECIES: M3 family oligoendopeptidase [Dyadobacter]MDR6807711.1 oligoendopeptidase F [Dyadobacter fermentans]MDR7045452.1 oligoendopeptidase F [Dyadobacter sp. BE242]MDR7199765.1 oligoendopeptidase F [Dyadobacter sp. BE34]MDR7217776.1 oligoendopeptidase F [Dyadobacter sp. BE31]MDR7265656.1 oligoendopeptidase F [Dyadobacter sp. BE32]